MKFASGFKTSYSSLLSIDLLTTNDYVSSSSFDGMYLVVIATVSYFLVLALIRTISFV